MNHRTVSFFAVVFCSSMVWLAPASSAEAPAAVKSPRALELAERIVELQRMRGFAEAEWEGQMSWVESERNESADLGMPQSYIDILREQQVDAPAEEWARVLARSLDVDQLDEAVRLLESPEYQAWVELQLQIYPEFVDSFLQQAVATGEILAEEMVSTYTEARTPEIEPVVDSSLAGAFEYVPGARVDAQLEQGMFFHEARVPVEKGVLASTFDDYAVQLLPDGERARVVSITAERAFPDMVKCDARHRALEQRLANLFEDSEETDCGFTRYLNDAGDTTMTLRCNEENLLKTHATLSFKITHKPTQAAMYSQAVENTGSEDSGHQAAAETE